MVILNAEETLKKGAEGIKECWCDDHCFHDGTPCPHCGGHEWCVGSYINEFCRDSGGMYVREIQGVKIRVKCVCSQDGNCKNCKGSGEYNHTFLVDFKKEEDGGELSFVYFKEEKGQYTLTFI